MYEDHGSVGAPIVRFEEGNSASRNIAQPSANPARRRSRPSRRAAASSLSMEQTSPGLLAGVMNPALPLKPSLEARMQGEALARPPKRRREDSQRDIGISSRPPRKARRSQRAHCDSHLPTEDAASSAFSESVLSLAPPPESDLLGGVGSPLPHESSVDVAATERSRRTPRQPPRRASKGGRRTHPAYQDDDGNGPSTEPPLLSGPSDSPKRPRKARRTDVPVIYADPPSTFQPSYEEPGFETYFEESMPLSSDWPQQQQQQQPHSYLPHLLPPPPLGYGFPYSGHQVPLSSPAAWLPADVAESSLYAQDEYSASAVASSTIGRDPNGQNAETLGLYLTEAALATEPGRTLIMEGIPRTHKTLEFLNHWAVAFGPVLFLELLARPAKGLIEFADPASAHLAFTSPVLFGTCHGVRVYWHRRETPIGLALKRVKALSTPGESWRFDTPALEELQEDEPFDEDMVEDDSTTPLIKPEDNVAESDHASIASSRPGSPSIGDAPPIPGSMDEESRADVTARTSSVPHHRPPPHPCLVLPPAIPNALDGMPSSSAKERPRGTPLNSAGDLIKPLAALESRTTLTPSLEAMEIRRGVASLASDGHAPMQPPAATSAAPARSSRRLDPVVPEISPWARAVMAEAQAAAHTPMVDVKTTLSTTNGLVSPQVAEVPPAAAATGTPALSPSVEALVDAFIDSAVREAVQPPLLVAFAPVAQLAKPLLSGQSAVPANGHFTQSTFPSLAPRTPLQRRVDVPRLPAVQIPAATPTEKLTLAAKQAHLEQYITQSKVLMGELSSARTKVEKDAIMQQLRVLRRAMDGDPATPAMASSSASTKTQPAFVWPGTAENAGFILLDDE